MLLSLFSALSFHTSKTNPLAHALRCSTTRQYHQQISQPRNLLKETRKWYYLANKVRARHQRLYRAVAAFHFVMAGDLIFLRAKDGWMEAPLDFEAMICCSICFYRSFISTDYSRCTVGVWPICLLGESFIPTLYLELVGDQYQSNSTLFSQR